MIKSHVSNVFYMHENCKFLIFKLSKVMQQYTYGVVDNLISVLLEIYCSLHQWKNFANRSRIDKVIAMGRVAPFFDSRCRWLHCVECWQYSIWLEAPGYLCASCLLPAFDAASVTWLSSRSSLAACDWPLSALSAVLSTRFDVAENLGRFLVRSVQARWMTVNWFQQ